VEVTGAQLHTVAAGDVDISTAQVGWSPGCWVPAPSTNPSGYRAGAAVSDGVHPFWNEQEAQRPVERDDAGDGCRRSRKWAGGTG
jgi:hypothetical protein